MLAVLLGVVLVLLLVASIQDARKREVADYVSYSIIAAAFLIRIVWYVIEKDLSIILYTAPSFVIIFAFSYAMYRLGQWGGGDVKIMLGMSIVLSDLMQILNFFINFSIIGALWAIMYTTYRGIRNWDLVSNKIHPMWAVIACVCVVIALIGQFVFPPTVCYLFSFTFLLIGSAKYVEVMDKYSSIKDIPVKDLVEGDWLVEEVAGVKKKGIGLTKEDIALLKKKRVKTVKVKEGIFFVHVFLLALIANMLFGNLFLNIMGLHQYLAGLSPIS